MTRRVASLLAAALVMLLVPVLYVASSVDVRRLRAEIEIERWAKRIVRQAGVGRDCSAVSDADIRRALDSAGRPSVKEGLDVSRFSVRCWETMRLVELRYYARYDVVSGVYRCEKDGFVQELQLAIHLEPRSVPQENDCISGVFPEAWKIPVGEATMFSVP